MEAKGQIKKALRAWTKASVICVISSPAIFLVWDMVESPHSALRTSSQIGLFLAVSGIASLVHFFAFIAIGLPIFLRFYSQPESLLWRWLTGILTGIMIGSISAPSVLPLIFNRPFTQDFMQSIFVGGLYGCITALACLTNRPDIEQDAALKQQE